MDRGKQGLKRSVVTDGAGIPLHVVSAGANRHDSPLLGPTLAGLEKLDELPEDVTVHLDRGYDSNLTRALLDALGFDGVIARKGVPAPIQAGSRWVVEQLHSWMNGYGKLRRCTEKLRHIVDFFLFLAAALVVLRQLIPRTHPLSLGHPPDLSSPQVGPIVGRSNSGRVCRFDSPPDEVGSEASR